VKTSSFDHSFGFGALYTLARLLLNRLEKIPMPKSEKDGLAKEVLDRWVSFQMALSNKRKYPAAEFTAFATSARRYVQAVGRDPLIHREVVSAINDLVDFLSVERRRVPDAVIYEASRLESLFFSGYDPHFDGDEPPGLYVGVVQESSQSCWPLS